MRARYRQDRRLSYLPRPSGPYSAVELFGAWRAIARDLERLPRETEARLIPDPDALQDAAWRLTRHDGSWSQDEALRLFSHLAGRVLEATPRYLVRNGSIVRVAEGRDNRVAVLAAFEEDEARHLEWRRERVRQYRAEGGSWQDVATRLGISAATARRDAESCSQTPNGEQLSPPLSVDRAAA